MSNPTPESRDIALSGRCYTREEAEEQAIASQVGDLRLSDGMDAAGRRALEGGHLNYGLSGTIRALPSIWHPTVHPCCEVSFGSPSIKLPLGKGQRFLSGGNLSYSLRFTHRFQELANLWTWLQTEDGN